MKTLTLTVLLTCCAAMLVHAQGDFLATLTYKEHLELAERFEQQAEFRQAAEQYARAYSAKPRKEEHAHQAAELFFLIKDYQLAGDYFALVKGDYSEYPLAGLNYARCLKQSGRFSEATSAYLAYLEDYRRDDRDIILQIVEQEVKGVAFAEQELGRMSTSTVVEHLDAGVDGPANEFAPMPLAEGTLYYISDRLGLTRMFRSDFRNQAWQEGQPAEQFPVVPGKHVGSGALSPAGDRFYFTLCDQAEFIGRPTARCTLHVIINEDGEWGRPIALPPYINTPGNSTTTPSVHQAGDTEVLLFSSDRLDGYGGMDLYRTERQLDSDATDFTFPQNLGPVVNSVADEVTPHYDPKSQTLHFASNGFVSMGGYDIFQTRGDRTAWNTPENMRSPVNSPADDYYYHPLPRSKRAMFASNRALPFGKTRTSNEDIFLVRPGVPTLAVTLQVVDSATSNALAGVALAVFTVDETGKRKLITSEMSEDGYFNLKLPMGASIELDAQRLDYRRRIERVEVPANRREGYQLPPFRMGRIALPLSDVQRIESERTGTSVGTVPTQQKTELRPTPPLSSTTPASTPPVAPTGQTDAPATSRIPPNSVTVQAPDPTTTTRPAPVLQSPQAARTNASQEPATSTTTTREVTRTYRIQIEARATFDADHRRYNRVREFGAISSDYVASKSLYRVLVGDFSSLADATRQLSNVQSAGYRDAFVAAFDGETYRGAVR